MRVTHADRNAPHLPGHRDFSFSGLKTAVCVTLRLRRRDLGLVGRAAAAAEIADTAASFQRVVVETLLDRLFDAARWYGARSVGIAGGVSANSQLREEAAKRAGAALGAAVSSEHGAVDRQCRDDCGSGPPTVPGGYRR